MDTVTVKQKTAFSFHNVTYFQVKLNTWAGASYYRDLNPI